MRFSAIYRISVYLMLVFASLVLSIDATDSKIAMLYPPAVAIAAGLAFLTVDRDPALGLSRRLSDMLAVVGTGLAIFEFRSDTDILLLALGHWLIYLEMILIFRPKTVGGDWLLLMLGLVQAMLGTVISQSDSVGSMLFFWAILTLWVLGLFSLQRDGIRARVANTAQARRTPREKEMYPGLFDAAFFMSALRVTLTTLALGGVIFLAMPRQSGAARSRLSDVGGQHLTGFDDEVQLGQLGEILENDNVVMNVELFDENDRSIAPEGEYLWRGVTLAIYEKGRWFRQATKAATFPLLPPTAIRSADPARLKGMIRQQIKLEANDSTVLFGIRPMQDATAGRRSAPELNAIDGRIFLNDPRHGTFDYEVRSYRNPDLPQPGESAPSPYRKTLLMGVPDAAKPRLRAIAETVLDRMLPPARRNDPHAVAKALESYLRDSGEFNYTLKMDVVDKDIDPVLDFLVNRKEGHCEYFASALALMLRSVDIPARLVNGFKGGDWNEIARVLNVRQKHAHSWVEAYLGTYPGPDRAPNWLVLDPTPGTERDQSVAKVGGFSANFRQATDLVRYVWVFYIVGYNSDRQTKLIYGPIRRLLREAQRGYGMMGRAIKYAYAQLIPWLHFPNLRAFISVRGFVVSFLMLLLLVGTARSLAWLVRKMLRRIWGPGDDASALAAGATHYRRLASLLLDVGLERSPPETQDEFARRATVFLTARGSNTEAVADVPRLVVEAFYRVRFGHLELGADVLQQLDSRLDALEASLQASQA
jgi:transglutaminase-like putative cysteine protease